MAGSYPNGFLESGGHDCRWHCVMSELVKLDIRSSDGSQLVHKYYRYPESTKGLVVTFPGNHYGIDGPLLYYPSEFLGARGWNTLALSYSYQSRAEEFEPGMIGDVLTECENAIRVCLSDVGYVKIGLLGKSLGALIIAQLCSSMSEIENAKAVYLTPPLNSPFFGQLFLQTAQEAHFGLGTGDRFYSEEELGKLQSEREFTLTLIENADHSMDIKGDIDATMEGMKRVVREVVEFIDSD